MPEKLMLQFLNIACGVCLALTTYSILQGYAPTMTLTFALLMFVLGYFGRGNDNV